MTKSIFARKKPVFTTFLQKLANPDLLKYGIV